MRYGDQERAGAAGPGALLSYLRGPGKDFDGNPNPPNNRYKFLGGEGFCAPVGPSAADEKFAESQMIANNSLLLQAVSRGQGTRQITKNTLHVTLSWGEGQKVSDDDMMAAARDCREKIRMSGCQMMVVRHQGENGAPDEKSYPHAHLVFSTRDVNTGLVADSFQRRYRGWWFAVEHDRKALEERGIPIPEKLQWQQDRAKMVREGNYQGLAGKFLENEATIKKSKINQALAYAGKFGQQMEAERAKFVDDNKLLGLRPAPSAPVMAYTNAEIYREETALINSARRLKETKGFALPKDILDKISKELTLGKDQDKAFRHAAGEDGFAVIIGPAGTGKSHTAKAIRKGYEGSRKVYGVSTTNDVVQQMEKDGLKSSTLAMANINIRNYERGMARREQQIRAGKTPKKPAPDAPFEHGAVFIGDEVGMFSTEDGRRFLRNVEKYNGKFIAVGDHAQHGSVPRGGWLKPLATRFGSAQLTENHRNKDKEVQESWDAMHRNKKPDWARAVDIMEKKGFIKRVPTRADAIDGIVNAWHRDHLANPEEKQLVIGTRRRDVNTMNERIQALRKQSGELGKEARLKINVGSDEVPEIKDLLVHVGDRLRLGANSPSKAMKAKGVTTGRFGTITSLNELPNGNHEVGFDVDREKKEQRRHFKISIGQAKSEDGAHVAIGRASLAYASTSIGAQGRTVNTKVLHDPATNCAGSYVNSTRHPKKHEYWVANEETENKEQLIDQLRSGDRKTAAHAYTMDKTERAKLKRTPHVKSPPLQPNQAPQQTPKRDVVHSIFNSATAKAAMAANAVRNKSLEISRGLGQTLRLTP